MTEKSRNKHLAMFDLTVRVFLWALLGYQMVWGDLTAALLVLLVLVWAMLYDIREEIRSRSRRGP